MLCKQTQHIISLMEQQIKYNIVNVQPLDELRDFNLDHSIELVSKLDGILKDVKTKDIILHDSSNKALHGDIGMIEIKYELIDKDRLMYLKSENMQM